jgi:hypothetical protein
MEAWGVLFTTPTATTSSFVIEPATACKVNVVGGSRTTPVDWVGDLERSTILSYLITNTVPAEGGTSRPRAS